MRPKSCSHEFALVAALVTILCAFLPTAVLAQPSIVSFQGQLADGGVPHDGAAQFKFAILCRGASMWSNDGSSSNGSEPTASVTLDVDQGVFSVLLGDPALSMVPLTADLLAPCTVEAMLRIWVRTDGTSEQLTDQPLSSSPFALRADTAERSDGNFTVQGTLSLKNSSGTTTISATPSTGQVVLTSLRFADGTVQTTAGGGGPVEDGDWTVVGSNMHAAVSGSVGIGTTSPSARLHVIGDLRSDGLEAGGFETRNPNNLNASVKLGWFNDVARLRVGGSGVGALNGYDFQTTSDISRLRILGNGNIGIGTTAPTQKLEVNGATLIQGDLTVQGSINVNGTVLGSGVVSIAPNAFQPDDNLQQFDRASLYYFGTQAGLGVTIEAPVYLPHGATITEYTVVLTDNYSPTATGSNVQTFFLRTPLSGASGQILANRSTTGAPGRVTLTQTGINHVVDNVNNVYSVAANWVTPPVGQESTLRHHGVVIRYTMN